MNSTVDLAGKTDITLIPSRFMRSVSFSGEINRGIHQLGSEENDIIKQYPGKPKGGQFQSLLFSLILQPVRINKPGAPLLGLAKSIYYFLKRHDGTTQRCILGEFIFYTPHFSNNPRRILFFFNLTEKKNWKQSVVLADHVTSAGHSLKRDHFKILAKGRSDTVD